jgi:hypothetical protein
MYPQGRGIDVQERQELFEMRDFVAAALTASRLKFTL